MSRFRPSFADLMQRVRRGDTVAFEQLLEDYGDAIRREVHFTLLDTRLRRFVGDSDIYQSVVVRFFDGIRAGQYSIERPAELVRLLKGIARTRIAELVRFWRAQRRDLGRTLPGGNAAGVYRDEPHPLETLGCREAAATARRHLSVADRQILNWREQGLMWEEIASRLGQSSGEAVRKQHQRAMAHLASLLQPVD